MGSIWREYVQKQVYRYLTQVQLVTTAIIEMKKKPTKTSLRKKLDTLFSIYIRTKYAMSNGNVSCYTCPKVAHYKEMQNGHFVPRQYLATRYDERNCRPQCYACNMLFNGQPSTFARKLEQEKKGIVSELDKLRHVITKDFPYEQLIEKYKNLTK